MRINSLYLLFLGLLMLLTSSCGADSSSQICTWSSDLERPNSEGLIDKITFSEKEGNTHVIFQKTPQNITETITVSPQREMIVSGTALDTARVILLQNPNYYQELIGEETEVSFAEINEALQCQ